MTCMLCTRTPTVTMEAAKHMYRRNNALLDLCAVPGHAGSLELRVSHDIQGPTMSRATVATVYSYARVTGCHRLSVRNEVRCMLQCTRCGTW